MIEGAEDRSHGSTYPAELSEAEGNAIWNLHRTVVEKRAEIEAAAFLIAAALVTIHDTGAFRSLGHDSFRSYCADPEVNISRSEAYRLMATYAAWKPHIDAGAVTVADMVAMGKEKAHAGAALVKDAPAERAADVAGTLATSSPADAARYVLAEKGAPPIQLYLFDLAGPLAAGVADLKRAPDAATAISELERLIARAQSALAELRAGTREGVTR